MGFRSIPILFHIKLGNFHFQLTTGISLPEGLMTACTLPITSKTLQISIATYEPSPLIVNKSPSLRMIRCNRCWPLYLNSTTSIGRSSPGEQGDKTIYWCPLNFFYVPKIKVGFLAWNPTFFRYLCFYHKT